MMAFLHFAAGCGLLIRSLEIGKWCRVPTVDHPKKRNGAYKYLGTHGFVQNHATMPDVAVWKPDAAAPAIDTAAFQAQAKRAAEELRLNQQQAASRASRILADCYTGLHPYLERKGFPAEKAPIWMRGDSRLLVVPMRVEGTLVGCQLIAEDGEKRFLPGQTTRMAQFVIGTGRPILCEGFATGLSVRAAFATIPGRHCVRVCFSAGNLAKVAELHSDGLLIADNDASGTGQRVAATSGLPFWLSDSEGEDFNDFHRRAGLFLASQALRKALKQ